MYYGCTQKLTWDLTQDSLIRNLIMFLDIGVSKLDYIVTEDGGASWAKRQGFTLALEWNKINFIMHTRF